VGLRHRLLAVATTRPRCHLVEAPGGADVRRAVEDALDDRGWSPATSPASADALVVAGPLPQGLEGAADVLWAQLPGPRARCVVEDPSDVDRALEGIRRELRDDRAQRTDASGRGADAVTPWLAGTGEEAHEAHDHDHGSDSDAEMNGGHDHEDVPGGHGDGGHGEHGGHHDHGDMDMAPGGLALAAGAEDRDGLEMDVLVHPFGPLLDRWPGGLELRVTLHGDAVGEAEARWWGEPPAPHPREVGAWDAVATTLSLAGDERGARTARRLRAATTSTDRREADRLRARLRRLGRARVLPAVAVRVLLDLTEAPVGGPSTRRVRVEDLVRGHDVADARLLVAAHGPLLSEDGVEETGDD
jgi:hypothetical protein